MLRFQHNPDLSAVRPSSSMTRTAVWGAAYNLVVARSTNNITVTVSASGNGTLSVITAQIKKPYAVGEAKINATSSSITPGTTVLTLTGGAVSQCTIKVTVKDSSGRYGEFEIPFNLESTYSVTRAVA